MRFIRFRLFPVRSPLLRESLLFSIPSVTKMFQFTEYSCFKNKACSIFNRTGFPIRKSTGQRLLATSPKLIAGCYVLHRLLMSRHPPYTLNEIFPRSYLERKKIILSQICLMLNLDCNLLYC